MVDILIFCMDCYGVEFDMFVKVEVNGNGVCDFYKVLMGLVMEL